MKEKLQSGFYIDVAELRNCTTSHRIIVDESLSDVRVEIQAMADVYPHFILANENGNKRRLDLL